MKSKKNPTNDAPRDNDVKQKRAGAIAVSPEDQSEELPGAEDERDEDLDEDMDDEAEDEMEEETGGSEVRTGTDSGEGDDFEVDRQAASREPGKRGEGDRGRGDESLSDGKE